MIHSISKCGLSVPGGHLGLVQPTLLASFGFKSAFGFSFFPATHPLSNFVQRNYPYITACSTPVASYRHRLW